jgi:hypothetical protein
MLCLWPALAFAGEIVVGPGESVADAISSAGDGAVILVDPAADPSGQGMIWGNAITIRALGDESADIPSLYLTEGADVTLEDVRVQSRDNMTRMIAVWGSTLRGTNVELENRHSSLGILADGASVIELYDLEMYDSNGWAVWAEPDEDGRTPDVSIVGCRIEGSTFGVINYQGDDATGRLHVEDCDIRGNTPVNGIVNVYGPITVELVGNDFRENTAYVLLDIEKADTRIERNHACGNTVAGAIRVAYTSAELHRNVLDMEGSAAGAPVLGLEDASAVVTHDTWIGDDTRDALIALSGEIAFTNTLFSGFDLQLPLDASATSSHALWDSNAPPPAWLADDDALVVADAGFDAGAWDVDGCDRWPAIAADSAAVDAGDDALPLEDGDTNLPDIGAVPFADPSSDTDDPLGADGDWWVTGGGSCGPRDGSAASLLLLLILRRRT